MSIEESPGENNLHWNYFLALESDMQRLSRYIEFDRKNDKVFSVELAHLLFAASSEFEVVARLLCEKLEPAASRKNIVDWRRVIYRHVPQIAGEHAFVRKYNIRLDTPLELFQYDQSPRWWDSYNEVKHARNVNFEQATLENALLALGSLFIVILYHKMAEMNLPLIAAYQALDKLKPESTLFRFAEARYERLGVF